MTGKRRMTRTVAPNDDEGLVGDKDFAKVSKIYYNDIKPAASSAAEFMQTIGEAYKVIKKSCGIQSMVAKFVFKLDDMEESKRDDALRCLAGLLTEMRMYLPRDMVDVAEDAGDESAPGVVVPMAPKDAKPRKPRLVTVPSAKEPISEDQLTQIAAKLAEKAAAEGDGGTKVLTPADESDDF